MIQYLIEAREKAETNKIKSMISEETSKKQMLLLKKTKTDLQKVQAKELQNISKVLTTKLNTARNTSNKNVVNMLKTVQSLQGNKAKPIKIPDIRNCEKEDNKNVT